MHGGVRYLEKAVFNLDYGQLKLVFEALHERKRMLENAPHLCTALPIMTVQPSCGERDVLRLKFRSALCTPGTATGLALRDGLLSDYESAPQAMEGHRIDIQPPKSII